MEVTKYWEEKPGQKSNSRRMASQIVYVALIFCAYMLYGVIHIAETVGDIVAGASAVGILFTTVGGTALYFLFSQKKQELQSDLDRQNV